MVVRWVKVLIRFFLVVHTKCFIVNLCHSTSLLSTLRRNLKGDVVSLMDFSRILLTEPSDFILIKCSSIAGINRRGETEILSSSGLRWRKEKEVLCKGRISIEIAVTVSDAYNFLYNVPLLCIARPTFTYWKNWSVSLSANLSLFHNWLIFFFYSF